MDFSGDMLVPRKVLVTSSGWWLVSTPLKHIIIVKLDHETPKDRGENYKTYLKLTTT